MADDRTVLDFYAQRWEQYGYDTRALGIGSRESQEIRFAILTQIADLRGASILDVGCGFGDLQSYLEGKGIAVRYSGLDLQPAFIEEARRRHPAGEFHCTDIERFEPDPARQNQDNEEALAGLIMLSRECARIAHYTGRHAPTVVT